MTCMNELGFSTNLAGKFKLAGTLPGILPSQKKAANRSEQLGKLILQSIWDVDPKVAQSTKRPVLLA